MTGRLDPPEYYDPERRTIWAETIGRLTARGRVFTADWQVLNTYVEAVAAHNQACKIRAATNVMITRGDRAVENPALTIQRKAAADIARASRALGLRADPMTAALADGPTAQPGRWCDEHGRSECVKQRNSGGDCHAIPVAGLACCKNHGGKSLAALREDGQVALARVYGGVPADVDPGAGLLDEVRRSAGIIGGLQALVMEIEAAGPGGPESGLWWGTVREVTGEDGVIVRERRAVPHVVLKALNEERDHFVKACLAAKTAGAQQEAVDMARALGAGVGRLLDAVFEALVLTAEQRERVPQVVPMILRRYDELTVPS